MSVPFVAFPCTASRGSIASHRGRARAASSCGRKERSAMCQKLTLTAACTDIYSSNKKFQLALLTSLGFQGSKSLSGIVIGLF